VDSGSAARFGVEFHRGLHQGLPKAAAMRQAALRLDEKRPRQPSLLLEWFFHARAGF